MKKLLVLIVAVLVTGCATVTKDLAKTVRYADGRVVGVKNIDFNLLDTGHFPLEEEAIFITDKMRYFLRNL